MREQRKEPRYYRIRASLFWGGITFTIALISAVYFRDKIWEEWQKRQEWTTVSYEGLPSKLEDTASCYLCGISEKNFTEIGLISLNDWHVLDFQIKDFDDGSGSRIAWGETEAFSYTSEIYPCRGMSSIKATLPENYDLDPTIIQKHLCQPCLDKVTDTLHFSKRKYEKKNTIPLCLVDFRTSEIYSLQDWHVGCAIKDYWVKMEYRENIVEVEVFYLPER